MYNVRRFINNLIHFSSYNKKFIIAFIDSVMVRSAIDPYEKAN